MERDDDIVIQYLLETRVSVRCESECDAMLKDGSRRSVLCLKKIFPCNSKVFYFRVSEIIANRPICTVGSCMMAWKIT